MKTFKVRFIFFKLYKCVELSAHSVSDAKLEGTKTEYGSYVHRFIDLWKSINGEESWLSNPFVWVVNFERVDIKNTDSIKIK